MPECLSEVEVVALATNQPVQRDHSAIQQHLNSCARCRRRVEDARLAVRPLQQAVGSPDDTIVLPQRHQPTKSVHTAATPAFSVEGYDVLERVQGGGQGVVYKAVQKSTSRMVALKVLPHEDTASARQKQRFEREVSLAASLRHPNIVTIYDSGLASGRYFFAMEYIHGQPLDVGARGFSRNEKLALFAKVCDAVAHAHQRNIVHRDLKPGNVLLDARGEPHVLDFGLAKSAGTAMLGMTSPSAAGDSTVASASRHHTPVTLTSQFMGTLAYASPEQTMGDPLLVDRRSDVYSLGVMLFELLTGEFPYRMPGDLVGTFEAIRHAVPLRPSQTSGGSDIDRDLDTIVLRALAKDPSRRYPSAEELAADIHRYLEGRPIAARQDSALYVATTKAKAAMRRHPALTALGFIAATTIIARFAAEVLLTVWPAPGQWFEYAAGGMLGLPGTLEHVRIVPLTVETEDVIDDLARAAGLQGVSADAWPSLRRAHGLLMERLSKAGARAVVWDIHFENDSEFDDDFVRGVKAMQDAGAGVAVAVEFWDVANPAMPPLADRIRDARVLWGGITVGVDVLSAMKVDLIVQHERASPLSSLALAGFNATKYPGMDPVLTLDERRSRVLLEYRVLDSPVMQAPRATADIPLSAARFASDDVHDRSSGLSERTLVGLYVILPPPEHALRDATRNYHEVFAMNDDALAAWCKGKTVVFCDNRPDGNGIFDLYETRGGRRIWGGEAHAIAIESLIAGAYPPRYPRVWTYTMIVAAAAGVGVLTAHHRARWRLPVVVIGLAMATVIIGACLVAIPLTGHLCNPAGPLLAMVLGLVGWRQLDRMHALRLESTYLGRSTAA